MSDYNKRNHFRVRYPPDDRPKLVAGNVTCGVVDVSEFGGRFIYPAALKTFVGQPLEVCITFRDGETCNVAGAVLRLDPDYNFCILRLTKGIPLARIMGEQRYLLKRYKI